MKYITAQDILVMHARIIDETGGSHGVRDVHLLLSLAERPKTSFGGHEQYKGIFAKSAVLLESIATYHVFIDGNKRTAFTVAARFLHLNGYEFCGANNAVESFMINVIVQKLTIKEITAWLKVNSKKIKK